MSGVRAFLIEFGDLAMRMKDTLKNFSRETMFWLQMIKNRGEREYLRLTS